ncbi:hypothetical protein Tco_1505956 [Tanacetum coccineum]
MSASLSKNLKELKEELIEETYAYADVRAQNQDLLITISELENKLQTVDKGKNAKKVSNTKVNTYRSKLFTSHLTPKHEQSRKHNENVLARGMYRITKTETQTPDSKTNINVCNSTGVESSNSVRRPKSKDTKSKDRVLKNNNNKRPSAHVRKMSSSVSIDSNKRETMHSNVCQSNASVLSTKTVNVVNDGSSIVCVSHEKCVPRYALSRNSSVKRALFTTPIAAKSKNLGATFVVAKSRLSVDVTPRATHKVIQLVLWIVDSGCSKHMTGNLQLLRYFIEKYLGNKDEAPQIVSSSVEQVANEPNSPVLNENADELVQEDVADLVGNVFYNAPPTLMFEEAESLLDAVWITAAHDCVNAAQLELVLLMNFKENMLIEVNAASENMLEVTTASEYQVNVANADLAGCNDDCKSTSGGIQFLVDKLVSWSSKKQDCTAMSTARS